MRLLVWVVWSDAQGERDLFFTDGEDALTAAEGARDEYLAAEGFASSMICHWR